MHPLLKQRLVFASGVFVPAGCILHIGVLQLILRGIGSISNIKLVTVV